MKKNPPPLPFFFNEKDSENSLSFIIVFCFTYLFEIFLSKFSSARTEIA